VKSIWSIPVQPEPLWTSQELPICDHGETTYMKNEHLPAFLSGPMQLTLVLRAGPISSGKVN